MIDRIRAERAIARHKKKVHFSFTYSSEFLGTKENVRDAFFGDYLGIEAWINNEVHWWSGTIKSYLPQDNGDVLELKIRCRSDLKRSPLELSDQLKAKLTQAYLEYPEAKDQPAVITVTCSLVKPKPLPTD